MEPAASPATPKASPESSDTNRSAAGIVLLMGGAVICALAVKLPMLGLMFLVYWQVVLVVVAVLGAIGGAILLARRKVVGAIIGAIASPLATYLTYSYIMWMASDMGRESLLIIEPILVNMLVVVLILAVPMRLWSKHEAQG